MLMVFSEKSKTSSKEEEMMHLSPIWLMSQSDRKDREHIQEVPRSEASLLIGGPDFLNYCGFDSLSASVNDINDYYTVTLNITFLNCSGKKAISELVYTNWGGHNICQVAHVEL